MLIKCSEKQVSLLCEPGDYKIPPPLYSRMRLNKGGRSLRESAVKPQVEAGADADTRLVAGTRIGK